MEQELREIAEVREAFENILHEVFVRVFELEYVLLDLLLEARVVRHQLLNPWLNQPSEDIVPDALDTCCSCAVEEAADFTKHIGLSQYAFFCLLLVGADFPDDNNTVTFDYEEHVLSLVSLLDQVFFRSCKHGA